MIRHMHLKMTDAVLNKLERDSVLFLQWFDRNAMKANLDKTHLLLSNSNLNLFGLLAATKSQMKTTFNYWALLSIIL